MIDLDYCPVCSHFRANHRELMEDVLVTPTILHSAPQKDRRYRDGRFRVIGCPHVRTAFGPWDTEQEARAGIKKAFARICEKMAANLFRE